MSNDNKFWLGVNFIVCSAICTIVLVSTNYYKDYNTKIVAMLQDGVNPVAIQCAISDSMGNNPTCLMLSTK